MKTQNTPEVLIKIENSINGTPTGEWNESFKSSTEDIESLGGIRNVNNRLLYYAGRPPWYDCEGKMKEAYIIGLCGGSASGKTTVSQNIIRQLGVPWVVILSLDSFYKVLSHEDHLAANRSEYDFDSPSAIDFDLAIETLKKMRSGKKVEIPIYDFVSHSRLENKTSVVYGASVIVVEGLMTFHPKALYDLLDLKIFVETDSDVRLSRRVLRDIKERGRDLPSILVQYARYVKPNFDKYIAPLIHLADFVIPWNDYNEPAVEVVSRLVKNNLEERGFIFRSKLLSNKSVDDSLINRVHVLPQSKQNVFLQTLIRNSTTCRQDFVRYSHRLMKMCIVKTLSLLDYSEKNTKVQESEELSMRPILSTKKICAVTVMRAGEAFEVPLKNMLYEYSKGKILIQTNELTLEPEFHYVKLPKSISDCTVLLFDATISTGAAALMAIRILIDHEVDEKNIIICSLIITPTGAQAILNVYPNVRIVGAVMDPEVSQNYFILPGIGNFGDRYSGR